jgi:hypothetical protein
VPVLAYEPIGGGEHFRDGRQIAQWVGHIASIAVRRPNSKRTDRLQKPGAPVYCRHE